MGPYFGNPVNGAIQIIVPDACADLSFHQLPAQVTSQEALDRLHVVGAQHPAEVVMQLQVGCGARRLVHRANDVGTVQQQCHQYQVISTTVCDATMWFGQKRAPYVFISGTEHPHHNENTILWHETPVYHANDVGTVQQQHHQHQVISTIVCDHIQCGLYGTHNPIFLSEKSNTCITMNVQSYDMSDTLTDFLVDHRH